MAQTDIDRWAAAGVAALQQDRSEQIRAAVGPALAGNPDKEAELRRYSAAAGVPLATARALPDEVKQRAQLSQFDAQGLARRFPATGAWISVPDNARLAVDDVHQITQVEQAVRQLGQAEPANADQRSTVQKLASSDFWIGAAKYLASANFDSDNNLLDDVAGGARHLSGLIGKGVSIVGLGPLGMASDKIGLTNGAADLAFGWAKMYADQADAEAAKPKQFHNELIRSSVELGLQLPMMAATGGASAAPEAMATVGQFLGQASAHAAKSMVVPALTTSVDTMQRVYAQTGDLSAAAKAGEVSYINSVASGVIPLSAPGKTLTRLLTGAGVGAVQGEASRGVNNAALPDGMEAPFRWGDVALNSVTGALMAGAMGPRAEPQRMAAIRAFNDAYEVAHAEQQNQQVAGLAQAASASKLRERDPQAFKQLVAAMADQGDLPPVLHVDAAELAKILDEHQITGGELAQTMPRVAEQLDNLREAGEMGRTPVEIPVEDFATHIAGSELEKPLLAQMRVNPEGKTVAEVEAFRQQQQADLQARADTLTEQHTQDQAYQDSLARMNTQVDQNLAGLGMRPDQFEANTALLRAFYQVQAERSGLLPHEYAERYPVRGSNKAVEGFDQFAGQLAATADQRALATAKERLAKGESAERVRQATGWFKGVDGFWRYEIADDTAAFRHADATTPDEMAERFGHEIVTQPDGENLHKALFRPGTPDYRGGWGRTPESARMSEQPAAVREAIDKLFQNGALDADTIKLIESQNARESMSGSKLYQALNTSDNLANDGSGKAASEALAAAGIKGIKYLDNHSRGDGAGTHNYVIFSGDDVAIRGQYYQRQQADEARGTYSPSTKTIALLKASNLSTFQHELGHFFLDTILHAAALPDAPADLRKDAATLLAWGGVTDLTDWHTRTVEQQRELHEKFATGWETYLMQGQAPTLELRSLFARFRAWMINVYKTLKGAPGEFTPEVRGVMDRMIASDDAIREAEAARRYMPLFDDPEKAGMSADEWAAYQAQGKDATELAIEQLTGKTLRDMARIDRLRSTSLAAVQKDAAAKMRAIEREVRAEVMSQPVYRAWAFLTGKGEADQRAQQDKETASKELDTTKDSLLVAIAKLGGLDRESARTDPGVHKDYHKTESGVFGKPVFRKSGGLSAERMLEALAAHYYLPPDASLHHLEDAIGEELAGTPQYSWEHNYGEAPLQSLDPEQVTHGKLRTSDLRDMFGVKDESWRRLSDLGMTSDKAGVAPDLVAELHGFESGHQLALALLSADHPREVIRGMSEQRMIERHGEIATPQAMARAADMAVANEVRAQFIASELKALKQAVGSAREIAQAAKEVALRTIDAQRVRDLREGRYTAASGRAAREAEKLSAKGDTAGAAMAKRDQLVNLELARASRDAVDYVGKAREYLTKFDTDQIRKTVDPDYVDQINALLERFDLRAAATGKELDRRASLADWIKAQQALGLEPDLPAKVLKEALRTSYKELTLAELKGLVDSVKQIEHLGRLKSKLLTAADQRAYEAVRDEMASSIEQHAGGRKADTRTPTTNLGLALKDLREFGAAHIKAATWARILDGGQDGGPVWEYLIRPANAAGDREVRMRAEATLALHDIMAPLFKDGGKMGGKGQFFPSINRSLNRQERIAIALNTGNEGNTQRLLGGEGWTREQIQPVLDAITPDEARAVQAIWDHFETYRPMVGEMERRIYGKEPNWVEPVPIKLGGQELRGGYYPVKYDPAASVRAEEHADAEGARRQLQGAYGAATVRRSFAKARAEEVTDRPLLYSLAGIYQGVNETIHALAWSEWLIDANRLLKSTAIDANRLLKSTAIDANRLLKSTAIDRAIRETYGPEAVRQFKTWRDAVAEGEQAVNGALDKALGKVRQSVSVAGLGFNVMSAAMQPLGFSQSVVRLGGEWAGKGLRHYLSAPVESTRQAAEMSDFMASRARTRFRELNELRNRVQDQSTAKIAMQESAYYLMMKCQQMVDVPTWWGGYEQAIAAGNDEARAIALADQAVIDSQGGGQTKDLSAIEMGGQAQRLFTVFYSFMNTALNLGVASKMTPTSKARMAADYLLLYTVPAVLGAMLKDALTPGDSGDYDDTKKLAKKMGAEQLGFLASLMVVVREFGEAGKAATGLSDRPRDYSGPAGVRLVTDTGTLAKQAHQGEFDTAFRKALVNILGDTMGLPSAQINRTITGAEALRDGKTKNPLAVVFGFQEPH